MAALALSALADLATASKRLRPWALPIAMVLGGAAATVVGLLDGRPDPAPAALIGVLVAGIAHATRRIIAVLPTMASARSQLVSGASSVLMCGAVAYTLGRILVA
jgi:predicted Abi (CAAX) family protease